MCVCAQEKQKSLFLSLKEKPGKTKKETGGIENQKGRTNRSFTTTFLCYADRLNDLEYRRTAHNEDEQGQQPRSDRILFLGVFRRFGHIATHRNVLAGLLVGNTDSLLWGHLSVCLLCEVLNTESGNVLCVAEALLLAAVGYGLL